MLRGGGVQPGQECHIVLRAAADPHPTRRPSPGPSLEALPQPCPQLVFVSGKVQAQRGGRGDVGVRQPEALSSKFEADVVAAERRLDEEHPRLSVGETPQCGSQYGDHRVPVRVQRDHRAIRHVADLADEGQSAAAAPALHRPVRHPAEQARTAARNRLRDARPPKRTAERRRSRAPSCTSSSHGGERRRVGPAGQGDRRAVRGRPGI